MAKTYSRIPTLARQQPPVECDDGEAYSAGAATTPASPTRSSGKSSCFGDSTTNGTTDTDGLPKGAADGYPALNTHVDCHQHLHEGCAQVTPRRRISSSSSQNGNNIPRPRTPSSVPCSTPGRRSGIPGSATLGPVTPPRPGTCSSSSSLATTCTPPLSTRPSMDASTSEAHMPRDSCYSMDVPPGLTVPTMVLPRRLVTSKNMQQPDRLVLSTQPSLDTTDLLTDVDRVAVGSTAHAFASPKKSASNIQVAVRMRPLSDKERSRGDHEAWGIDDQQNVGHFKGGKYEAKYHYDTVFDQKSTNQEVFEQLVQPLLPPVLTGVSATVFAYGVTSSGKTHTMMGGAHEGGYEPGLVPLVVQEVFDLIAVQQQRDMEKPQSGHTTTYTVKLSMMEIYNEVLNDLLDPVNTNLKLREDAHKGVVVVEQLLEEVVTSPEHALQCISRGDTYRKVSATAYNEDSSRSHTICRLIVESVTCPIGANNSSSVTSTPRAGRGIPITPRTGRVRNGGQDAAPGSCTTTAVINLIDLAGSESAKVSVSKGQRMEGSFINKSLLTLGTVINKLAAAGPAARQHQQQHIPFRDSKLTRLLQASMTGMGARIAIVCNITPAAAQFEETNNTLKFATRAKLVRVAVSAQQTVNEHVLLRQYRHELKELRSQLAALLAAQPTQRQQYRDQYQQHGSVFGASAGTELEENGDGFGSGVGDGCKEGDMGGDNELAGQLRHVTQLLHAEREARLKAEMEVSVLESRLNSLLCLIASDARKGLGRGDQYMSVNCTKRRDGENCTKRRDGETSWKRGDSASHRKRGDMENGHAQLQSGRCSAGGRDTVPHIMHAALPYASEGGALHKHHMHVQHSGSTAATTTTHTDGDAQPTTHTDAAARTPRSAFKRRGTSEGGSASRIPPPGVLESNPALVSSLSSTPNSTPSHRKSSAGGEHHHRNDASTSGENYSLQTTLESDGTQTGKGGLSHMACSPTQLHASTAPNTAAGSLSGARAIGTTMPVDPAAAVAGGLAASAASAAASGAGFGTSAAGHVPAGPQGQAGGPAGRQAASLPASSRPSLAGFSVLGTSRRSSESSYDVDAELALLEQIQQMQCDLHTARPHQEPCWLTTAPSSGSVATSAVTTMSDLNSNPHNAHHQVFSPVSGGSMLGDADIDLEIQVLLADREVLQDQVVSVEMANAALQQQAAQLVAQAAQARKEADKERTAKEQLECKMNELRSELEKLQVTVMHRQEQLQQQGLELGLGPNHTPAPAISLESRICPSHG